MKAEESLNREKWEGVEHLHAEYTVGAPVTDVQETTHHNLGYVVK